MRRVGIVFGVCVLAFALAACIPPVLLGAPSIVGTAQVGETLTVNPGQWLLSGVYGYQWQRCESDGTGCADIAGATGSSYVIVTPDGGKRLRVRVTNTNDFGVQAAYTGPSEVGASSGFGATTCVSVASDGTQGSIH